MQRLSASECSVLDVKNDVRRTSAVAHIYKAVGELGVGDGLLITKTEWLNKNRPSQTGFPKEVRTSNRKYEVKTLTDESGYVVIRKA